MRTVKCDRARFTDEMVAAGYDAPERGPHADSQFLYQRDEDRYVGWCLGILNATPPAAPAVTEGATWEQEQARFFGVPVEQIAAPAAAVPESPGAEAKKIEGDA